MFDLNNLEWMFRLFHNIKCRRKLSLPPSESPKKGSKKLAVEVVNVNFLIKTSGVLTGVQLSTFRSNSPLTYGTIDSPSSQTQSTGFVIPVTHFYV